MPTTEIPQGDTPEALGYLIRGKTFPGLSGNAPSHSDAANRVAKAAIALWRERNLWERYSGYQGEAYRNEMASEMRRDLAKRLGVGSFAFVLPSFLLPMAVQILVALIQQTVPLLVDWLTNIDSAEGRQWMRAVATDGTE